MPANVSDLSSFRADFPILDEIVNGHPLVYLDNAASTQKPLAVLDRVREYYLHENANVHRGLHALSTRATEAYEAARARVAGFVGGAANEVVFTRGTTEGINLVANTWGVQNLRPGDAILLTEMEHHSNLVPWQLLAQRTGARLLFVPVKEDGALDLERIDVLLADGVKLFAFVHLSNSLGTINPAAELCAAARRAGVITLVDAAQSAAHLPLDVRALGCDFLVLSGHKICAPTGIGVLWGRADLLESMPPFHGGGEMILSVTYERSTYKEPPHRFEAGTPNIAGAVGLGAAIEYLERVGRAAILEHDQGLANYAVERLAEVAGLRILGSGGTRGGIVSFVMEGAHPHDLTTFADQYGVALRGGHHCTQPLMKKFRLPGTTRASFSFYNTVGEVDRLAEVLAHAARFFR